MRTAELACILRESMELHVNLWPRHSQRVKVTAAGDVLNIDEHTVAYYGR
jgi:hypothetical protein